MNCILLIGDQRIEFQAPDSIPVKDIRNNALFNNRELSLSHPGQVFFKVKKHDK
jgi:hypothetical protein